MNRKFGKLDEQHRIAYAPDWVIRVDRHHEEWDEPVFAEDGSPVVDPATGRQKVERETRDWDTERRELHPNEDDYAHAKDGPWLTIDSERPQSANGAGYAWTELGDEVDGRIVRRWDERTPVRRATRYSKLKIIVAAKAAGKWDSLKEFIASAGYEDEWAACQFLSSDYAQFAEAKEAIVAAGVATAEEVEAILLASVDGARIAAGTGVA